MYMVFLGVLIPTAAAAFKNVALLNYVLTTICPYSDFRVTPIIGYLPISCTTTRLGFFFGGDVQTSLGGEGVNP